MLRGPGSFLTARIPPRQLVSSARGGHHRTIGTDPRPYADLVATPEHQADRDTHAAVLEYAQAQPDFAGSWWARSGGKLTPVVSFTRDLPKHQQRIASLRQAPGLVLVQRQVPLTELRDAGRRALDLDLQSATLCSVSANEKTSRVVVRVEGEPSPEDLQLLADRIGHEPEIRPGGRARRRPKRGGLSNTHH